MTLSEILRIVGYYYEFKNNQFYIYDEYDDNYEEIGETKQDVLNIISGQLENHLNDIAMDVLQNINSNNQTNDDIHFPEELNNGISYKDIEQLQLLRKYVYEYIVVNKPFCDLIDSLIDIDTIIIDKH